MIYLWGKELNTSNDSGTIQYFMLFNPFNSSSYTFHLAQTDGSDSSNNFQSKKIIGVHYNKQQQLQVLII